MKFANNLFVAALLLGGAGASADADSMAGALLEALLAEASRGGQYRAPDEGEVTRAEQLFARLLAGESASALAAELSALGLELHALPDDPTARVLREAASERRGRGLFVLRPGVRGDVLQVPHSFKDRQTREIGLLLFAEGRFAAAAWNTVPRWQEHEGRRIDSDLAHQPVSYFNAFTRALGRHAPLSRVLQIHGFDPGKRKSRLAAEAAIILGNGSERSTPPLRTTGDCLSRRLAVTVGVYPDSVRELGGTTNAQATALRGIGHDGFLHVEMSAVFRERMLTDPATRSIWLNCLQSPR